MTQTPAKLWTNITGRKQTPAKEKNTETKNGDCGDHCSTGIQQVTACTSKHSQLLKAFFVWLLRIELSLLVWSDLYPIKSNCGMEQYLEGETWRKVLLGTQQCRHRRITLQKAKKDLKKKQTCISIPINRDQVRIVRLKIRPRALSIRFM